MSIHSSNSKRGFSLVEMLTVIAIFVIVTGVILANLPEFRNRASLELVAQDISLTIRQAQVFGISSRQFSEEFPAFGVHFYEPTSNNKSFILFGDQEEVVGSGVGNGYFDGSSCSGSSECIESFRLEGGIEILKLCYADSTGNKILPSAKGDLDITFKRPNPEPKVKDLVSYDRVKIVLQTIRSEETRSINIWNTGQISVSRDDCN